MTHEFLMPFPPSVNTYYATVRGMRVLSKKGRQYKKDVLDALIEQGVDELMIADRVAISIIINPPCNRRRDLDNFLKAPLDALTNAGFWVDDSQVDEITVARGVKSKVGFLSVIVEVR